MKNKMTREAYLMQTATDWLHYHPCPGTQDNIHRAFVAGAQWADAHPQSPWIGVDEGYPAKINKFLSEPVLCRYTRGGKEYYHVAQYDFEYKQWMIEDVTHWMYIPAINTQTN